MDSSDNALSALDAIDTVAFKVGLKGYNVDEVDEFLERLSVETRQLKDQLHQQRQQLRQAAERINQLESGRGPAVPAPAAAPAPAPVVSRPLAGSGPEQVTAMIVMAQQFIEQAQQEAETKAREMTVAAQERAREIVGEARSRAEDEVNRLNGLKQRLSEDVDMLARQLESERARLSSALAEFSRWVESSLQMGGSSPRASHAAAIESSPAHVASTPTRPLSPPPAPAPQPSVGQVLSFDQTTREDRA